MAPLQRDCIQPGTHQYANRHLTAPEVSSTASVPHRPAISTRQSCRAAPARDWAATRDPEPLGRRTPTEEWMRDAPARPPATHRRAPGRMPPSSVDTRASHRTARRHHRHPLPAPTGCWPASADPEQHQSAPTCNPGRVALSCPSITRGRTGFDAVHETQGACRGTADLVNPAVTTIVANDNFALAA